MNYEIQFARVTNFGKLSDRFLNSQHQKANDLTKSSMGEIFSLIEILSPWYNSAQVGQNILNTFTHEYYQGGSTSDLANFENSLKKVNESLANITQNGETEWIGKLNSILTTIIDNNLILSSTGKVEAYLFRDGKINHLNDGLSGQAEIHPLKTFSNIITGQLKARDIILLANRGLFDYLSLESLRQIISLNSPSAAALQITKLLRKSKIRNANLIILSLVSREDQIEEPLKETETVFYLDRSNESFLGKGKTLWETILKPATKIITGTGLQFIGQLAQSIGQKTKVIFKNLRPKKEDRLANETPPPEPDKFQKEFILKDSRSDDLLKDEEINYSPDLYVHYYQEKQKKPYKWQSFFNTFKKLTVNFFQWFWGLYRDKNRRKYFYIICAAILILIIGLVVGLRGKGRDNLSNLEAQKILDQAIAAQKEGKNLLSTGSNDKAKEQLLLAIEKAQSITKSPLVAKDAQTVIAASYQELDKLTQTTRLSQLEPVWTLAEPLKAIFIISGEVVAIGENDIYKGTLLGGKPQKVASIPKNKGHFIAGTSLGNSLYLYTSEQNLFEFTPSAGKTNQIKIAQDGRWETANALTGYTGSLYLLDGVLGQIYKHSSSQDVFQAGEEYLAANNPLKESVSLAIDGSIFVLKNNGEVLEFQKSKRQDFTLKNIPTPWEKITDARKIYTDSDTPSIYILDAGKSRVLTFDKDGFFIHQYALPDSFQKISDFTVSFKSKKIWVLNDNSLYEIAI